MVKWTIEELRLVMKDQEKIRNISVIAHVDHGKSTLTDSLIGKAGLINEEKEGTLRYTDTRLDEQLRGITIKSTSISLYYTRQDNSNYLVNVIDCPGHVDFSSEVTASLRITDGALVVVDCIEGVCVQTVTVLRQALNENIVPILFVNKLDRLFIELQSSLEQCYQSLRTSIESVNVICSSYNIELNANQGNIGFGSGLQAWGFNLNIISDMYGGKFGIPKSSLMNKLWGEHYYDNEKKKWIKHNNNGLLQRGFNQFVLLPIKILFDAVTNNKEEIYLNIIKSLCIDNIKMEEINKLKNAGKSKELIKYIMKHWLPAGECLLEMIIDHLPSPLKAQVNKINSIYSGPLDTEEAYAIQTCNQKSNIMSMYISKMIPTSQKGRFIAFGRVFSGTLKVGQEVRILSNDSNNKKDINIDKIKNILLMMGKTNEIINECPSGNICGIIGIDQYLLKSGTITTSENMYPFNTMKFSVSPIVQVAIEPLHQSQLPHLIEALKKLSKTDPLIKISTNQKGQHIMAGAGTLHLEICLNDLKNDYMNGNEVKISDPIVSYCETISNKSYQTCVSKSSNKLNRLYASSEPILDIEFIKALDNQTINISMKKEICEQFKLNKDEVRKIWTFGCAPDGLTNMIVDQSKGVQYLNDIKDHVINSFMYASSHGVLCEEPMRGIRFNLEDAKIHSDPSHRNVGQIISCARRVFYACELASDARIMEPLFLVEVNVNSNQTNNVCQTITKKRGNIIEINDRVIGGTTTIKAHIPVSESFDLTQVLRKNTSGQAFAQTSFSHWSMINQDPFVKDNLANRIVLQSRKMQGLKLELPNINEYHDKI